MVALSAPAPASDGRPTALPRCARPEPETAAEPGRSTWLKAQEVKGEAIAPAHSIRTLGQYRKSAIPITHSVTLPGSHPQKLAANRRRPVRRVCSPFRGPMRSIGAAFQSGKRSGGRRAKRGLTDWSSSRVRREKATSRFPVCDEKSSFPRPARHRSSHRAQRRSGAVVRPAQRANP